MLDHVETKLDVGIGRRDFVRQGIVLGLKRAPHGQVVVGRQGPQHLRSLNFGRFLALLGRRRIGRLPCLDERGRVRSSALVGLNNEPPLIREERTDAFQQHPPWCATESKSPTHVHDRLRPREGPSNVALSMHATTHVAGSKLPLPATARPTAIKRADCRHDSDIDGSQAKDRLRQLKPNPPKQDVRPASADEPHMPTWYAQGADASDQTNHSPRLTFH